ncbi:PREDICTED: subtilisin-like protease SBT4.1 [Camelina sativa]|uniref:Subtilisin-like protease SBT4.1 n=1 Tax=Camelina sativa TaxID=90675 RepID=A0ABM0ZLC2_CAMSA|nr:PREDICTED: subtilisin-like protease SBT4.1 [Camelina sativa]
MKMISQILLIFFAITFSVVCAGRTLGPSPHNTLMKIYVVHVDFGSYHGDCKQYQQLLKKVVHGRSPEDAFVYCYKEVISGFAAELTHEEAEKLNGEKGIYGVDEEIIYSIDVEPSSRHRLLPNDINN